MRKKLLNKLVIAVVGNKIDLIDQEEISTDVAFQFSKVQK